MFLLNELDPFDYARHLNSDEIRARVYVGGDVERTYELVECDCGEPVTFTCEVCGMEPDVALLPTWELLVRLGAFLYPDKELAMFPDTMSRTRAERVDVLARRLDLRVSLWHPADDLSQMELEAQRMRIASTEAEPVDFPPDIDDMESEQLPRAA